MKIVGAVIRFLWASYSWPVSVFQAGSLWVLYLIVATIAWFISCGLFVVMLVHGWWWLILAVMPTMRLMWVCLNGSIDATGAHRRGA